MGAHGHNGFTAAVLKRLLPVTWLVLTAAAQADPISSTPRFTFAGNLDFAVTGGTLRSQPNSGDACAVNNSDTATLSGIPGGSTVVAAFLYWAGSGPTPDNNVTFNGSGISADRTFTENYTIGAISLDFFSGFADVTGRVSGNGLYSFADLTVTNTNLGGGGSYCTSQAVLSGWGLIVVYSNPSEPLRVLNIFDGLQAFRGSQIVLNPSNFIVPASPVDGRIGILSWEGDVENSAVFGGVAENLLFDGVSTPPVNLTDALNPTNNQFNSTVNVNGAANEYGVDLDVYDLSPYLRAGDSSAQTTYSSGGDLVLLSAEVISVTNTPAVDLALTKSHSGDFYPGGSHTFNLTVSNNGPSNATGAVQISDTLPARLAFSSFNSTDAGWNCAAALQVVTCSHPGPLAAGSALAAVNVVVDVSDGPSAGISNTATVSGGLFDPISGNNSSTDNINIVAPDLSTSTKTVVDVNGVPAQPGDTLRFTVSVTESAGADASGVSVQDVLDGLLTNLNVINAGGGTDNSSATTLQIDDLAVGAGATVDIVFEADIVNSAVAGDVVTNSADVTNPRDGGTVTTVSSSDVSIGSIPPASGVKNLYMGDIQGSQNNPVLPMTLSRIPLAAPGSPARVRIRRQDNNRVWALTPVLQADLSLDGSAVPVVLQMRRNNNTANRNVRVSLAYDLGGLATPIGCVDAVLSSSGAAGLSNTQTRTFTFNVPQTDGSCNPLGGGPITIPAGASITLAVDNQVGGSSTGQAIFVYPFSDSSPDTSRTELPSTTVINVDSLTFYDAPFPGGTPVTALSRGQDVYVRTVVSDPFGTADISAVNYSITDALAATAAAGAMPQVQDSGADTATYEIAYTIPLSGPDGNWTVDVSADEGTEGTVSHSAQAGFQVVGANVLLEKEVEVISDAISASNPKAIPDAVVEYVIRVANQGADAMAADSVVLQDSLPPDLRFYFGVPPNPFTFEDGTPASGLSFTFGGLGDGGDDIQFSNDGGATFITPVVDALGFDATVPKINYVELNPKGVMAGDSGGGAPGFEIRFQMRVE